MSRPPRWRSRAPWLLAFAYLLAACEPDSVVAPLTPSDGPDEVLVDYDITQDPSNVTLEPGYFKVCKVGPPGYVATFDVEELHWRAIKEVYDTTRAVVQVEAGKCKLVAQNEPDPWVRVTERLEPGFVVDSIVFTYDREIKESAQGGPYQHDPTSGTYVILDSATVVAAIGTAGTPDDEDGLPYPRYRRAGAVAIFYNSPEKPKKPKIDVIKVAEEDTITAGETMRFDIQVSSTGGSTAQDVTLYDILPYSWELDWSIESQPAGKPCRIILGVLYCDFGDLAAGETRTVTIATPTSSKSCKKYVNAVLVKGKNVHPVTAYDAVHVICPPKKHPKIYLKKWAEDGEVKAGSKAQFNLLVKSIGDATAEDVVLYDELPEAYGVSWYISSQPYGNPCSISRGTLKCEFGDLKPGESRQVSIKTSTSSKSGKKLYNTAWAKGDNVDKVTDSAVIEIKSSSKYDWDHKDDKYDSKHDSKDDSKYDWDWHW